jgi:hypothetical protein
MSGMQLDDHPWFSSKLFFRCCQENRDLRKERSAREAKFK